MDLIVKKASALTTEEKTALGLTGIPDNWPVESYIYVDTVPDGFELMTDTDLATLKSNNQAAYDAWVQSKRPIIRTPTDLVYSARFNSVAATLKTIRKNFTLADDVLLTSFIFGGKGAGQAALYKTVAADQEFVPTGNGFNSSGDVSAWSNTSLGANASNAWAYSTAQFNEGTGSASQTFTTAIAAALSEITYTYSSPKDMSDWTYINAHVRITVASGGSASRTVSIILTDALGNTRTYSTVGATDAAPFSTEQWTLVQGDLENPTSESGVFDIYNVKKVSLRLVDGTAKSGTIYWDNVRLSSSQTFIQRIYVTSNTRFEIPMDPSEPIDAGEVLTIAIKNNDVSSKEFTASAKGVLR